MKKLILVLALSLLSVTWVYAIPQEIEEALKLNRINHFD
jgi:hypothetical protein